MPDSSDWRDASSRRTFLKFGAAGSATLVAGCFGGDDDPEDTDTPDETDGTVEPGGEVNDAQFRIFDPIGTTPSERHLNPWNPSQSGAWHPGALIMDRLVQYSPASNESYPIMAESWEMAEDDVLECEISDEYTWHNGDSFVAQDWVMEQEIEMALREADQGAGGSGDFEPYMSDVEAVDDHLIRVTLNEPLSETFAVQNTIGSVHGDLSRGIFTKHDDDQWSEWHDALVNGEGDEYDTALEEITTTAYPAIDSEDAIGHGPFQISEVGDDVIICERYEDHPNADVINFERASLHVFANSSQVFQPYSEGNVDATHSGFPVQNDLQERLPETHTLFREARSSNSLFTFNNGNGVDGYESPVFNNNVRKALAHVFDQQQVGQLLEGVYQLFDWPPCRVPGKVLEEGTVDVSDFEKYGGNDTERATTLLEEEGYTLENGEWFTPDGERFALEILNGTERPDFQVWIQNLTEFGIDVTQNQVDNATFDERRHGGEYDIIPDGSSANGIAAMWAPGLVVDWLGSLTNFEPETEIPMPVGDPEGSEGTKTINVAEHITQWMITNDDQYHRELMWWWNQTLPEMEVMYEPDAGGLNTENWEFQGVPDPIVNGVDDALYIALGKLDEGAIQYTG